MGKQGVSVAHPVPYAGWIYDKSGQNFSRIEKKKLIHAGHRPEKGSTQIPIFAPRPCSRAPGASASLQTCVLRGAWSASRSQSSVLRRRYSVPSRVRQSARLSESRRFRRRFARARQRAWRRGPGGACVDAID